MIAALFCGVTIPQFVLGVYLVTLDAINPGESARKRVTCVGGTLITEFSPHCPFLRSGIDCLILNIPVIPISGDGRLTATPMPPIPLDAFRLCVFARHRPIEIGYTSISLFFGKVAHPSTSCTPSGPHGISRFYCLRRNNRLQP